MSFLIEDALAQTAPVAQEPSAMATLLPLVVFIIVFYFLLIRPQQKRNKEQRELLGGLSKGDEVMLAGGMLGRITKVVDDYVIVEVADRIELRFQKTAVTGALPKGTLKNISGQ